MGQVRKDRTAEDLSAGMQTPYDTSEESDTDAGLLPIIGLESNAIFGITWDAHSQQKKHKLQMYITTETGSQVDTAIKRITLNKCILPVITY